MMGVSGASTTGVSSIFLMSFGFSVPHENRIMETKSEKSSLK
jgi:hypothetical protein